MGKGLSRPLAMVAALLLVLVTVVRSNPAPTAAAGKSKPRCHAMTKKLHGKKKRVKVCTTRPKPTPTPTATLQPAGVFAAALAAQVTAATTQDARTNALLRVMDALHIGVYTSAGKAVVRGGERSAADFFLYDFELQAIADALGEQRTWSLGEAVAALQTAHITAGAGGLDATSLRTTILAAVQSDAGSNSPQVLAIDLLRELGTRHATPYDLRQDVPADTVRLDALQLLLVAANTLLPALHGATEHTRTMRALQAGGVCVDPITGGPDAWNVGWHLEPGPGSIRATGSALDLHGMLLATIGIRFEERSDPVHPAHVTHFGPAGHAMNAGDEMHFEVRAEVDLNAPGSVACGPLVSAQLPRQGPLAGVAIDWHADDLKTYGQVSLDPVSGLTDGTGSASLVFRPKDELFPGFGQEILTAGQVLPTPNYSLALPGMTVPIQPLFMSWKLSYHQPRGLMFHATVSADLAHAQGPNDTVVGLAGRSNPATWHTAQSWAGHICGQYPVGDWKVTYIMEDRMTYFVGAPTDQSSTFQADWTLDKNWNFSATADGGKTPIHFVPGSHPMIEITYDPNPFSDYWSPMRKSQTISVPVEEDPTCPDNSNSRTT